MKCPQALIPGASLSVTVNGTIVFAEGFGLRDVTNNLPVTTSTIFSVGSVSKAFTSTLAAMMNDEGLLDFSLPVTTYLPSFKLVDPFANRFISVRDMLSHRTGLSSNDYIWLANVNITRPQLLSSLQYLPSDLQFRSFFQYNNLMVFAGGYFATTIVNGGVSWESMLQDRILSPLQMVNTTADIYEAIATGNFAIPYSPNSEGVLMPLPADANKDCMLVAPAAGVMSTVLDLSRWLQFHINLGVYGGQRLVSAFNLSLTHTPCSISVYDPLPAPEYPAPFFVTTYGMGWWLGNYRGHPMVFHTGEVNGMSAMACLFPNDNISIAFLTNRDQIADGLLPMPMFVLDILLGYEPWITDENICNIYGPPAELSERYSPRKTVLRKDSSHRKRPSSSSSSSSSSSPSSPSSPPVSPSTDYLGSYSHPAYGQVVVFLNATGSLWFTMGNYRCLLIPSGNDIFSTECYTEIDGGDGPEEWAAQFGRDITSGKVTSASIWVPEANPPPITFLSQGYNVQSCPYLQFVPPEQ